MPNAKNFGLVGIGGSVILSKGGVRIKNSAGILEARNLADDAYAIVRGADPVGNDDFVTKRVHDTTTVADNARGANADLAFNGASGTLIASLTGRVVKAIVNVSVAFDDTDTATLEIGSDGDQDSIMEIGEIDLTVVGVYVAETYVEFTTTEIEFYFVADGGSPSAGVCDIEVGYITD